MFRNSHLQRKVWTYATFLCCAELTLLNQSRIGSPDQDPSFQRAQGVRALGQDSLVFIDCNLTYI